MTENLEKEQLRKWMALWTEIDKVYTAFLKNWSLSLNEFLVVEYLYQHPSGAEPGELASDLNVMRQLITIILKDLEKRGYILRKDLKLDHRKRQITLSKRGMRFAGEVCGAVDTVDLSSWLTFAPEEREQLVSHSQRFCDALKAATADGRKNLDGGVAR